MVVEGTCLYIAGGPEPSLLKGGDESLPLHCEDYYDTIFFLKSYTIDKIKA